MISLLKKNNVKKYDFIIYYRKNGKLKRVTYSI